MEIKLYPDIKSCLDAVFGPTVLRPCRCDDEPDIEKADPVQARRSCGCFKWNFAFSWMPPKGYPDVINWCFCDCHPIINSTPVCYPSATMPHAERLRDTKAEGFVLPVKRSANAQSEAPLC